jgi:translocation and assembly module TamB
MADASPPDAPAAPARRGPSRIVAWSLAVGIALAIVVVVALTWLSSEHALRTVLDEAVERSGGRLAVERATGSLTGTLAIARLTWRDDDGTDVVAEDVAIAFSPMRLLHGTVAVDSASARHLTVVLPAADDEPLVLPDSIAPPLAIDAGRIAIDRVDWRRGEQSGTLTGVALAYRGDASGHRVRDLRIATEGAMLAGNVTVGARKPFDIDADATLDLAAPHPTGRVQATAKGTIEALVVEATSTVAGVAAQGRLELAPLADQPIVAGRVHAQDVDLAALDKALPTTKLDLVVDAKPSAGGFTGTLEARNADAGSLDRDRVPLAHVASAFVLRERVLELSQLAAQVPGGGSLTGTGTIDLDGWRNRWKVAIAGLDLRQVHASLQATKLAGRIEADVQGDVQRVRGEVAQDDLRLAFDARHDGKTVVAERFAAEARGGSLSGSGQIALAGPRPFRVEARARGFDPSRFGAFPPGAIDGTIRAEGAAAGDPAARAEIDVARGSRLAGLPLHARVRGRFTQASAEGLDADVVLGGSRLAASGAVQRRGQPLAIEFASRELLELAPLLPKDAPRVAGALDARLRLEPRANGMAFSVDARGERLRIDDDVSFASLRVNGSGVHAAPLRSPRVEALADLRLDATASGIVAPEGRRLDAAKIALQGSAAAHTLVVAVTQGPQSLDARLAGSAADLATAPRWRGRVEALALRGVPGYDRVALAAPASVELARDAIVVGAARIEGGATLVDVDGFAWRDGRVETRGRFRGLAVAPLARQAGVETRWPTDIVLGGRWDIASVPQWKGTLAIEREGGDVYVEEPGDDAGNRIALGVSALRLEATIDGARLQANGELRARLGGNTLVDATLQAPQGALHPFDDAARLGGTVRAHIPSLATLQPWLGTTARVQGQAIAEVNLAGTLGDPGFTGQLVGYGLRVDMPQYGINLVDGRLRVVSGAEGLRLEELVFVGGDGRFTATGTIALPRERGSAGKSTRIAWKAQDFRILNHPDRRLVVDGEGTLALVDSRWLLAGRIAVDQGLVAYRSTEDTKLADDIVVVGRPRPTRAEGGGAGFDAPLDLDLAIEVGRDFRFSGEGLDTRLAGKLQIASRKGEPITARGTIRAVRGTYNAFGQRLTIDRGRLIFDGPVANPALDIVALRKNQAVEAGVEITGTVRAPLVRLTSNPPVPDNEKLSWLLTGGPPGAATQREAVALAAAQAALAGRGGTSMTQRFAQNIGVDDISFLKRGDGNGDDMLAGQVVSVGKRITDRLYVAYEQGLELANNALRLEYVLSRYFTVSAYAGTNSGVELKFRRNWR